jgi:hypothetical protein
MKRKSVQLLIIPTYSLDGDAVNVGHIMETKTQSAVIVPTKDALCQIKCELRSKKKMAFV